MVFQHKFFQYDISCQAAEFLAELADEVDVVLPDIWQNVLVTHFQLVLWLKPHLELIQLKYEHPLKQLLFFISKSAVHEH